MHRLTFLQLKKYFWALFLALTFFPFLAKRVYLGLFPEQSDNQLIEFFIDKARFPVFEAVFIYYFALKKRGTFLLLLQLTFLVMMMIKTAFHFIVESSLVLHYFNSPGAMIVIKKDLTFLYSNSVMFFVLFETAVFLLLQILLFLIGKEIRRKNFLYHFQKLLRKQIFRESYFQVEKSFSLSSFSELGRANQSIFPYGDRLLKLKRKKRISQLSNKRINDYVY